MWTARDDYLGAKTTQRRDENDKMLNPECLCKEKRVGIRRV